MTARPVTIPTQYQLVETRLQERRDKSRTRCHLCLWRCTLRHGQRGFCQAHVNRHGTLYNLSYGITSAMDVGPIEAKPVRHFRPGSRVMSVGSYGIHVETRTNVIPSRNDDLDMLGRIAVWIRDHLGAYSPWHITKFFPAYKLTHLPATPSEILWRAHDVARMAGLHNVYVYDDKGCDCADENLPVAAYLSQDPAHVHAVKKCAASCCGDEGVLLKKYEQRLDSRDQSVGDR